MNDIVQAPSWKEIKEAVQDMDALYTQAVARACDVGDMLRLVRQTMDQKSFSKLIWENLSRTEEWARRIIILSFRREAALTCNNPTEAYEAVKALPQSKEEEEERAKWPRAKRGPQKGKGGRKPKVPKEEVIVPKIDYTAIQNRLLNYTESRLVDKSATEEQRNEIRRFCSIASIERLGEESCMMELDNLLDSLPHKKDEPEPKKETSYSEGFQKFMNEEGDKIFGEISEAFKKSLPTGMVPEKPTTLEAAYLVLGKLLYAYHETHPQIRRSVLKILKQYIHPDKANTGNEELFVILQQTEEVLDREL